MAAEDAIVAGERGAQGEEEEEEVELRAKEDTTVFGPKRLRINKIDENTTKNN